MQELQLNATCCDCRDYRYRCILEPDKRLPQKQTYGEQIYPRPHTHNSHTHTHTHRVSTLCTEWEAVLLHGQRKPKPKRIVPPTRGGGLGTLWPLAKLACSQEELQRFLQLENTKTEIGRGRAWLRAAINERTLENYMHTILGSDQALRRVLCTSMPSLHTVRNS